MYMSCVFVYEVCVCVYVRIFHRSKMKCLIVLQNIKNKFGRVIEKNKRSVLLLLLFIELYFYMHIF